MPTEKPAFTISPESEGVITDPRLQRLLELWDRLDEDAGVPNSLGVTLLVHGVTYSGMLIAGRVWAKTMGHLLRTAQQNHQVSALSVFFDDVEKSYEEAGETDEGRHFVHLANAVVGTPSQGTTTGLLLRIRASDVSGWSVGTAGPLPAFDPSRLGSQPPAAPQS